MNDADIEMTMLTEAANTAHAYEAKYGCAHFSLQHMTCTKCGYVFADFDAWHEMQGAIADGDWDYTQQLENDDNEREHRHNPSFCAKCGGNCRW